MGQPEVEEWELEMEEEAELQTVGVGRVTGIVGA
jgi:hypothetical protein